MVVVVWAAGTTVMLSPNSPGLSRSLKLVELVPASTSTLHCGLVAVNDDPVRVTVVVVCPDPAVPLGESGVEPDSISLIVYPAERSCCS